MKTLLILVDGMRPDALVKTKNAKYLLENSKYTLNAKSLLGMLMLKVSVGDKITITAEGDDGNDAVEALAKLI